MFKITDSRSIIKQIVSGICWSPLVIIGLAAATFVIGIIGLVLYGLFTSGWTKFFQFIGQQIAIWAVILTWLYGMEWSRKN